MYFQTRRTTRHLAATGKSSAEPLPEDEELPVLRRSQRARTPTHHFASEMAATTPRKQQTAAPPTKPKSPRKRQLRLEEEENTDEDEFDVQRSEYELRSHFARRRSPRRIEERHYFHSEIPQPRKTQGSNGSASADNTTLSQFGGTTEGGAAAAVLSSDEEEERGRGGQGSSVTPQISVYESRVRKRLSTLSSLTRKKVAEALTGLAGRKDDEPATSQSKSAFPPPEASQPAEPPAHLSSSHHVYETRSRSIDPHPTEPSTSSFSPVVTRRKLHSTTVTTAAVPSGPKVRDQPPSSEDSSTDSPPDLTAFDTQPRAQKTPPVLTTTAKVPQWMKFGWEEMFFIFVVVSLILFAYYCFYSDDC